MPSRRRSAATNSERSASLTTAFPMVMRPAVFSSSPAIMRSVVVLPQPDGPSSVVKLPRGCDRDAIAHELEMHQRIGPGLLEVPEESNGRGLREVGFLPKHAG